MAKISQGPRTVTAVADTTGRNTGLWTASFDPSVIGIHYTQYEVYKMVVRLNASAGVVSWTIWNGAHPYEGFQASVIATWADPTPMPVDSGETLYFFFNEPSSDGTPPMVTIWCQVDNESARLQ